MAEFIRLAEVVNKKKEDCKVVVNGAGSAGVAGVEPSQPTNVAATMHTLNAQAINFFITFSSLNRF